MVSFCIDGLDATSHIGYERRLMILYKYVYLNLIDHFKVTRPPLGPIVNNICLIGWLVVLE